MKYEKKSNNYCLIREQCFPNNVGIYIIYKSILPMKIIMISGGHEYFTFCGWKWLQKQINYTLGVISFTTLKHKVITYILHAFIEWSQCNQ